ncbi:hypothetical protein H4Q26_016611 [Puccinia striiformis f. sp. tritici PST-130]|nr:hypothetical protein H4Q26_016611 [Puccinia striiformis f. sp. tritici PST-130]
MLIVVSSAITSQRKFFSSEHAWQAAVKTLGGHVLGRYEDQGGPGGARRGRHKSLETTDHQEEMRITTRTSGSMTTRKAGGWPEGNPVSGCR